MNSNLNKVELLWLWYDYHTEKYDQQLSNIPSPNDEGAVIVIGENRHLSEKHARSLHREIHDVAKFYEVPVELMASEKKYRLKETTRYRMEKYEYITREMPQAYSFLDDYYKEMNVKYRIDLAKLKRIDFL